MSAQNPSPDVPRILHLVNSHRWTGAAVPAVYLAAGQVAAGAEVCVAGTAGGSLEKRARGMDVPWSGAVAFHRTSLPHRLVQDYRAVKRLVAEFQPDAVHVHLSRGHNLAVAALRSVPAERRPVLVRSVHRFRAGFVPLHRAIFRSTDGILVPSASEGEAIAKRLGIANLRFDLLRGTVDSGVFRPRTDSAVSALREAWGAGKGSVVLGVVSRLRKERGISLVVDAAENALRRHERAMLVICGRGNYAEELEKRLRDSPVGERIRYLGYIDPDELPAYYNAFDVSVLAKPGNDATCRAAIEAMACGKPLIAGDVGALRDLTRNGETGWCVPVKDSTGLAEAMGDSIANDESRQERGRAAREKVLREHTSEATGRLSLEFYATLRSARQA